MLSKSVWIPLFVALPSVAFATTLSVPSQYPTIQAAMSAAQNGDIVEVADGSYSGTGNTSLSFDGKGFTLRSVNGPGACIIDGQGNGPVFWIVADEPESAVVEGFTVIGSNGSSGGAIFCHHDSRPTFVRCVFRENSGPQGGVVFCDTTSAPTFRSCVFAGNTATLGGVACLTGGSHATFESCLFVGNQASQKGGAIYAYTFGPATTLRHSTFSGNSAAIQGGAIAAIGSATDIEVDHCLLWGDAAPAGPELALVLATATSTAGPLVSVAHSDVQSGAAAVHQEAGSTLVWGAGNIQLDPNFADPAGPDGNPATWQDNDVHLEAPSPCIEGGDPALVPPPGSLDIDGDPRVLCAIVDIGADESADCAASELVRGECNGDGAFDLADPIALLAILFPTGVTGAPACADACDGNDDGALNIADAIALLGALFGSPPTTLPPPAACGADPTPDGLGCAFSGACP